MAIPSNLMIDAEIYFKKAFLEAESEWAVHKKIINISNEKGGIRKQIPKSIINNKLIYIFFNSDFPFIHVDFNNNKGYAHVIENEPAFDKFMHHVYFFNRLRNLLKK